MARRPDPYSRDAGKFVSPLQFSSSLCTSAWLNTTGTRRFGFARTTLSSQGSSCCNTSLYRNRMACRAWFWVDGETFRFTARCVRNNGRSTILFLAKNLRSASHRRTNLDSMGVTDRIQADFNLGPILPRTPDPVLLAASVTTRAIDPSNRTARVKGSDRPAGTVPVCENLGATSEAE